MQISTGKNKILSIPGRTSVPSKATIDGSRTPPPSYKQKGLKQFSPPEESSNAPPVVLIKTWMWMMSVSNDKDLNNQGRQRLVDTFGSIEHAVSYMHSKV